MAKQNNKKQTETRTEPVVVEEPSTPVQPVVVEEPSTPVVQQGGKKRRTQQVQQGVEQAQQVQQGVEQAQQVQPAQQGVEQAQQVQQGVEPTQQVQQGGKRKRQAKQDKPVVEPVLTTPQEASNTVDSNSSSAEQQQGGKKKRTFKPREQKQLATGADETTQVQTQDEQVVDSKGKHLRSFKVKLPGDDEYDGRFTGLTPYQAANKALSKYFRLAPAGSALSEVTFSICESTRNSRKSVYTYVGSRVRLETPVTYSIAGGRDIVKNFKNSLRKVKKVQQQGAGLAPEENMCVA
jgi:hypothetical protein